MNWEVKPTAYYEKRERRASNWKLWLCIGMILRKCNLISYFFVGIPSPSISQKSSARHVPSIVEAFSSPRILFRTSRLSKGLGISCNEYYFVAKYNSRTKKVRWASFAKHLVIHDPFWQSCYYVYLSVKAIR